MMFSPNRKAPSFTAGVGVKAPGVPLFHKSAAWTNSGRPYPAEAQRCSCPRFPGACQLNRRHRLPRRRNAHHTAPRCGTDLAAGCKRILCSPTATHLVVDLRIQLYLRHKARADALNLVRARQRLRLNTEDQEPILGRVCAEVPAHAPAAADACHERYPPRRRYPPRFPGRCSPHRRVRRVHKLTGDEAVRNFRRQLVRLGNAPTPCPFAPSLSTSSTPYAFIS